MSRRNKLTAALILAGICLPATASANGFFLYELSPAGVAQGGATVAEGAEPATVAFNPAGMTRLEGFQLQANVYTYINANYHESPEGLREDAVTGVFPIPALFMTYRPTDWLTAGIGTYSIYGLSLEWPDEWSGYHIIKRSSLRSYQIQPSVAVGPFAGVSVGAGVDVVFGQVEFSRGLPLGGGNWGLSTIGGATTGIGANFGVLYEATEWLNLGVSYRTPIKMNLDPGQADFEVPAAFDQQLRDQEVTTGLTLPGIFVAGARVWPAKQFSLEFDATYLQWSSYDKLVFDFEDDALNQTQVTDYSDAWEFRLGGQYDLDKLALRAGVLLDLSPVPDSTLDPLLPDSTRIIPSVGVGYQFADWVRADAAYQFVYFVERTVDAEENVFPGTYKAIVHTIVLGGTVML